MSLKIKWFETVLMPAQHILKKLDPENQRSVEEVIFDLQPLQDQYVNLVVRNRPDLVPGIDIKEALNIYNSFHLLKKASTWGDVPVQYCDSSGSKSKRFVIPDADLPSTSADEEEVPSLLAVH
jgi:hypothetical protein